MEEEKKGGTGANKTEAEEWDSELGKMKEKLKRIREFRDSKWNFGKEKKKRIILMTITW